MPLRVSTIAFLNPAPLLYNFEHEPAATLLREHYEVHSTSPAICAAELHSGSADLGLIPIAALTPSLAVVPGCTIASRDEVRSILLLVKNPAGLAVSEALERVKMVAADSASRSSAAYTQILFQHFHHTHPMFLNVPADPAAMLAVADAALLIGDPALLARERQAAIEAAAGTPLLWLDLAHLWRQRTGLPWVAAVWALRPDSLAAVGLSAQQLIDDLTASRDAGLAHTEQLVEEWTPRLAISAETIRTYLRHNIHYTLDPDCLRTIELFRALAAEIGLLPPLTVQTLEALA
ncbi:MAG: menaquinone biosynthetic enzyme MqnA/MqnD family protein [Acidobacteriaceae bacterium]